MYIAMYALFLLFYNYQCHRGCLVSWLRPTTITLVNVEGVRTSMTETQPRNMATQPLDP